MQPGRWTLDGCSKGRGLTIEGVQQHVGGKVNLVLVALSVRTAQTTKARLQRKSVAACHHCQMHCEGTEYSCKHSTWRAQADLVAAICSACFPEAVHHLRTEPLAATGNTVRHKTLPVVGGTSCTPGGAICSSGSGSELYTRWCWLLCECWQSLLQRRAVKQPAHMQLHPDTNCSCVVSLTFLSWSYRLLDREMRHKPATGKSKF
jgi:hypothetical protein